MQKETHVSEMESFHPTARSGLTTDNFVSVWLLDLLGIFEHRIKCAI